MSEFNVTVEGGKTVRLKTAGKYCDRDIVVTAEGGGSGDDLFVAVSERTATQVSHSTVKSIGQYMFYGYGALKSIDFPNAVNIGAYAFYDCTGLTSLNIPNVITTSNYSFYNVNTATKIYLPNLRAVGAYAFRQCRKITRAYFPNLITAGNYGLSRCSVLAVADLGNASTVASNLFAEDSKLTTIILRKTDGIATLAATNAFTSTPFNTANSAAKAYVPSALIETYQTATNWSTLFTNNSIQFVALEGSAYEDVDWGNE